MKLRCRARKRIGRLKTIDAHTGKQPRRAKQQSRSNNEKWNRTRQTGVFYRLGGPFPSVNGLGQALGGDRFQSGCDGVVRCGLQP